jgi:hypothetical protein
MASQINNRVGVCSCWISSAGNAVNDEELTAVQRTRKTGVLDCAGGVISRLRTASSDHGISSSRKEEKKH